MALTTQQQVEEFADSLSKSADAVHDRLIDAIRNKEVDQVVAQSIFQDEAALRQRANSLYLEAAKSVVQGIGDSQEALVKLIHDAEEKIKIIKEIASFIDLTADLLVLASAAYAAKPAPIIAALKEVKEDVGDIKKELI